MVFRCPYIQAHYNEAVIYLNFGTPKNNEFSIWNIYYFTFGTIVVVVVVLLFYVHGKHLRSCRDGQLT